MPNKLDQYDIKNLRKRAKMSLKEMGEHLGVALQTVHRWEKGESRPSQLAMRQLHRLDKKIDGKRTQASR